MCVCVHGLPPMVAFFLVVLLGMVCSCGTGLLLNGRQLPRATIGCRPKLAVDQKKGNQFQFNPGKQNELIDLQNFRASTALVAQSI